MKYPSVLLALLLWAVFAAPSAQSQTPSSDTTFVTLARGTGLTIGAFVQSDARWGRDDATDGFSVRRARLRLSGTVRGARVFVQTDFAKAPALIDARIRIPLARRLSVAGGVYKAPFSQEVLRSASDLLFLDRAQVVRSIAPQREIGLSARFDIVPDRLQLDAGLFNGNGNGLQPNDNNRFLYVARLSGQAPLAGGTLRYGGDIGYSEDDAVDLGRAAESFAGTRLLIGANAGITHGRWLLEGELVAAQLDADDGPTTDPYGFYVAGGAFIADRHQLMLRYETLDPDRPALDSQDEATIGYNFFWTDALKLQANYIAPTADLTDGHVGLRLQIALK